MKKIFLILLNIVLLHQVIVAQRFAASIESEGNVLGLNLEVEDGDFLDLEFGQIEFFIRTASSSEVEISSIKVDATNFSGNIPVRLISDKLVGEYRVFHFGYGTQPSSIKRNYHEGSIYHLLDIELSGVEEGAYFELVHDHENYTSYLNLTSGEGVDLAKLEAGLEGELLVDVFSDVSKTEGGAIYTQGTQIKLQEATPVNLVYSTSNVEVSLYPNPVVDRLNLSIESAESERVELMIQDITGKHLLSKTVDLEQGHNQVDWKLKQLPAGAYLVVAQGENIKFSHKLTVAK